MSDMVAPARQLRQRRRVASNFEERLIRDALELGIPIDTLLRFQRAGYAPQPAQMRFHAAARAADREGGPIHIGMGGARGPGKSTCAFSQMVIDDCQRVPGLKGLFLRKVAKSAKESFEDLRQSLLMRVPHDYKKHANLLELPNRSKVILGHFRTEADIDNYLGLQYDLIVIEEDTQLTASKKRDILTCLRTAKRNWRPRTYRTTNPGGIDHMGFKQQFIMPYREKKETDTRFIPATVLDNVFVNKEYRKMLENLVGWKRRAWLNGDWDIVAGQYFDNWNSEAAVFDASAFTLPQGIPVWASMDYGFTHPTAVYFYAEIGGEIYVFEEHVENKKLPDYHAAVIKERLAKWGRTPEDLECFVAGADVFANKGDRQAKTIAQQYEEYGIVLSRAAMDRISGWSEILRRLGDLERNIAPTLHISSSCSRLINCLPALQHDPKRPEDVLKVNADEDGTLGDDEGDSLRYGVMARVGWMQPAPADSPLGKVVYDL